MMSKNWMTTVAGLVSAGASFIIFGQQLGYFTPPHWLTGLAMFIAIGGLAGLGITAKQYNVTGGSVGQPSTPTALEAANQAPNEVNPPATTPGAKPSPAVVVVVPPTSVSPKE